MLGQFSIDVCKGQGVGGWMTNVAEIYSLTSQSCLTCRGDHKSYIQHAVWHMRWDTQRLMLMAGSGNSRLVCFCRTSCRINHMTYASRPPLHEFSIKCFSLELAGTKYKTLWDIHRLSVSAKWFVTCICIKQNSTQPPLLLLLLLLSAYLHILHCNGVLNCYLFNDVTSTTLRPRHSSGG
jgi:hypothetical protein